VDCSVIKVFHTLWVTNIQYADTLQFEYIHEAGHDKEVKYYTGAGGYCIITVRCICLTWGKGQYLVLVRKRDVCAYREQYSDASQQNTVLPIISPFYGVNPSVGTVLEIFWAKENKPQFAAAKTKNPPPPPPPPDLIAIVQDCFRIYSAVFTE
jgi:hypothetical protein